MASDTSRPSRQEGEPHPIVRYVEDPLVEVTDHVTEIPEVKDSGATGDQEAGEKALVHPSQEPLFAPPITAAIQGLASSNAKNMGGVVVANLLSGSFSQLSHELQDAKLDLKNTRREFTTTHGELSKCKTQVAVLEERVSTSSRQKHLCNMAIAGGSIILGLAVQLDHQTLGAIPYVLGGIGCLFVLMGWLWPSKENAH